MQENNVYKSQVSILYSYVGKLKLFMVFNGTLHNRNNVIVTAICKVSYTGKFLYYLCHLFLFCFCGITCIKDKEIFGPIIRKK